jgi:hypothetical protein
VRGDSEPPCVPSLTLRGDSEPPCVPSLTLRPSDVCGGRCARLPCLTNGAASRVGEQVVDVTFIGNMICQFASSMPDFKKMRASK